MKVPDSVKLGKSKYSIGLHRSLPNGIRGRVYLEAKHIQITTHQRRVPREPIDISETFWHEITHAILYEMNSPLYKDERFVTGFSKLMNQAIYSARFSERIVD